MKKLNKKGFTLVELLAVMVILALLMVIVANVALPAMNKAKKNGLVVYSQRLAEKAREMYLTDGSPAEGKTYTVEDLMGSDAAQNYSGELYVKADSSGNIKVTISKAIKDTKNNICIKTSSETSSGTSREINSSLGINNVDSGC